MQRLAFSSQRQLKPVAAEQSTNNWAGARGHDNPHAVRVISARAHKGPGFGMEDARTILGVHDRPLLAPIVKPRVDLDPAGTTAVAAAEAAVRGGLGLVKDGQASKMSLEKGVERPVPRRPEMSGQVYKRIFSAASSGVRPRFKETWMAAA